MALYLRTFFRLLSTWVHRGVLAEIPRSASRFAADSPISPLRGPGPTRSDAERGDDTQVRSGRVVIDALVVAPSPSYRRAWFPKALNDPSMAADRRVERQRARADDVPCLARWQRRGRGERTPRPLIRRLS